MHTTRETATQLSQSGRPEWANFTMGLLAALAACVPFWVVVALSVYRLI